MSNQAKRELTLEEWVGGLPPSHRARSELAALKRQLEHYGKRSDALRDFIRDQGWETEAWGCDIYDFVMDKAREHAALKRENEMLFDALVHSGYDPNDCIDCGGPPHNEHCRFWKLRNILPFDMVLTPEFTGGTTPTYFSAQDKE